MTGTSAQTARWIVRRDEGRRRPAPGEPRPGPRHLRGRAPAAHDDDGARGRRVLVLGQLPARAARGRRGRPGRRRDAAEQAVAGATPSPTRRPRRTAIRSAAAPSSRPSRTPTTTGASIVTIQPRSAPSSCASSASSRSASRGPPRPSSRCPSRWAARRTTTASDSTRAGSPTTTNVPGNTDWQNPATSVAGGQWTNPDRAFTQQRLLRDRDHQQRGPAMDHLRPAGPDPGERHDRRPRGAPHGREPHRTATTPTAGWSWKRPGTAAPTGRPTSRRSRSSAISQRRPDRRHPTPTPRRGAPTTGTAPTSRTPTSGSG